MNCLKCLTPNSYKNRFCGTCGTVLPDSPFKQLHPNVTIKGPTGIFLDTPVTGKPMGIKEIAALERKEPKSPHKSAIQDSPKTTKNVRSPSVGSDNCERCHTPNALNNNYCSNCAWLLGDSSKHSKAGYYYCEKCLAPNNDVANNKSCGNCGWRFNPIPPSNFIRNVLIGVVIGVVLTIIVLIVAAVKSGEVTLIVMGEWFIIQDNFPFQ